MAPLPPPLVPGAAVGQIALPRVFGLSSAPLEGAITTRRSATAFNPYVSTPQATLSRLLSLSCGLTTATDKAAKIRFRRASPSAGARYPIDTYVISQRVKGLSPGVYRYVQADHSLLWLREGNFGSALAGWLLDQPSFRDVSASFVLAGNMERLEDRYGARGYRYMLLEAGHIAQNLCLLGATLGLGVQVCGGFVDAAINRLIGCETSTNYALYVIGVGQPA